MDEWSSELAFRDAGHGCDEFGLDPRWIRESARLLSPLYTHYFRVRSFGHRQIPAEGSGILASNHSGTLPLDGMMIYLDVLKHTKGRIARPIADHFVSMLPFVSTLYSRVGVVGGSRGNFRRLLESGELLLVFPEGVPGISKPFSRRYQLQRWRVGHVELAIRYGTPVIPVAVVGAEEQMPQIARLPIRAFGIPFLPITATPFPLPVRYAIYYGPPVDVHRQYTPKQADDPEVLEAAALQVKQAVQALLDEGLQRREGIFS